MNTKPNPHKWLELATSKDGNRPDYKIVHGNVGADGYRAHRDNSLPPAENDPFVDRINECGTIPSRPRNRVTVSRMELVHACKRALALRDEWDRKNKNAPALFFDMNGSLNYYAKNEQGRISAEIIDGVKVTDKVKSIKNGLKYETHRMIYKHHNPERVVSFCLNTFYLMDALQGMEGETVEIDIAARNAPFYMTDGTHEAVIMPVSI